MAKNKNIDLPHDLALALATQKGWDAHQAGSPRKALPAEYRNTAHADEACAWVDGWERFGKCNAECRTIEAETTSTISAVAAAIAILISDLRDEAERAADREQRLERMLELLKVVLGSDVVRSAEEISAH